MHTWHYQPCRKPPRSRAGFTLVELLIVVGILLMLAALTLAVFNAGDESDRLRSSARQVQSALLGARDRAIKAKVARGLRFILQDPAPLSLPLTADQVGKSTVTSMVYIGPPELWSQGSIQVGRADFDVPALNSGELLWGGTGNNDSVPGNQYPNGSQDQRIIRGFGTDWKLLFDQGLLTNDARIEIPANSGDWYTVNTYFLQSLNASTLPIYMDLQSDPLNPQAYNNTENSNPAPPGYPTPLPQYEVLLIQAAQFRFNNDSFPTDGLPSQPMLRPDATGKGGYRLELLPAILPGQEPMKLTSGIVIDLDRSQIPNTWFRPGWDAMMMNRITPGSGNQYYRLYNETVRPIYLDVMFSPRGTIATGAVAAGGPIHLYLSTIEDATLNQQIETPIEYAAYPSEDSERNATLPGVTTRNAADLGSGASLVMSLFPQTGYVASFPVDITDIRNNLTGAMGPDGLADDPFRFAKTGGTAGR